MLVSLLIISWIIKIQPKPITKVVQNVIQNVSRSLELDLKDYSKVSIDAGVIDDYGIVTLTSKCYRITAYTEPAQAESIKNGLKGKIGFRPTAHDIIKTIFEEVGIKVLMVKVYGIKNNTFLGKLIIQYGNNVLSIESRPSDATAIAVRFNAPVYVKNELLEKYGKYIC